uniref:Uncharacterized protein n=1 Tax=Marseillevirus LCMAC103 TaxID=2506604 RepID=A0A481YVU6_9VIRU|nr:MAG: uncharacterized protein LCMAC103_03710 [Marseillevirus LCMAC103]
MLRVKQMAEQKIVDELYNKVLAAVNGKSISVGELVGVTLHAMQLVQLAPGLSGLEKKALVTGLVQRIVSDSGLLSAADAAAANLFIAVTLPTLIDTMKAIAKTGADLVRATQCCW